MPKDRRSPSYRCRSSPYSCGNNHDDKRTHKSPSVQIGNESEFEEARCPICIEHPHNAVLLLCSSGDKGCRPYMCDTSSRHSNCLDQFRKSAMNNQLVCPLCRGQIDGWTAVDSARNFMNSKTRNCSLDTCDFVGNYSQLREHARRVHPHVKPTDVDPEREQEWRNLGDDMDQQDMLNIQFETDYDDASLEFLDDVAFLATPLWDSDYASFVSIFESDFEGVFPDLDPALDNDTNVFFDDLDGMLSILSSHELEIRESGTSRSTRSPSPGRSRENARTSGSRNSTHVRQWSNRQPRSRNR